MTCFFEGVDFEDVIRNAISIGGGSDTIGGVAGGGAGAVFGGPAKKIKKGKERERVAGGERGELGGPGHVIKKRHLKPMLILSPQQSL